MLVVRVEDIFRGIVWFGLWVWGLVLVCCLCYGKLMGSRGLDEIIDVLKR